MADPNPGRALIPRWRSSHVDQRGIVIAKKSAFEDADAGTWDTFTVAASALEDSISGFSWTDPTKLIGSTGLQNDMATSTAAWVENTVNFAAFTFAGLGGWSGDPAVRALRSVTLNMYAHAAYPTPDPGVTGNTRVRFIVEFPTRKKALVLDGTPALFAGGAVAQTLVASVDLTPYLIDEVLIAIPFMTAAEAELMIKQIRVKVQVWTGGLHNVTQWYVGQVELSIEVFADGDKQDWQGQYWFRVTTKDPLDGSFDVSIHEEFQDRVIDHTRNYQYHTIAPGRMSSAFSGGSIDRWIQWLVKDQNKNPAPDTNPPTEAQWNLFTAVPFRILPDSVSAMLHDELRIIWLVEIAAVLWFDAMLWELAPQSGPGNPACWRAPFDRSSMPFPVWYIEGFEINGEDTPLTQVFHPYDCYSLADTYFIAEHADFFDPTGFPANYIYVHLPDEHSPAANRGMGLGMRVVLPLSTAEINAGPGNRIPYMPVVQQVPALSVSIEDFERGIIYQPGGTLSMLNLPLPDSNGLDIYGLFWRLLQVDPPNPGMGGVLMHNRPMRVKAMTPGMKWQEALEFFEGVVSWPKGDSALIDRQTVQLNVEGVEAEMALAQIASAKIGRAEFPNLHSSADGKTKTVAFGSGHLKTVAYLVDVGEWDVPTGQRKPKALAGENFSAVSAVYVAGAVPTYSWTFDPVTQIIEFNTLVQTEIEGLRDAEITFDGDGEVLDDYAGTPSATVQAGTLFKRFLSEMVPADRVITQSFDALDDPALDGTTHALRCLFTKETLVRDALRYVESSRYVNLLRRPDGYMDVVPRDYADIDQNTVWLRATDIIDEPQFFSETEHMAKELIIEWNGYAIPGVMLTSYSAQNPHIEGQYNIRSERTVSTYHASLAGVEWLAAKQRADRPYTGCTVTVRRAAWFSQPGSTVVARSIRPALDENGLLEWQVWQLLQMENVPPDGNQRLRLRKTGTLHPFARPQ